MVNNVVIHANIIFSKHLIILPIINFFRIFYDNIFILCDNIDHNIKSLYYDEKIKLLNLNDFKNDIVISDFLLHKNDNYYINKDNIKNHNELYTNLNLSELLFWKYFDITITDNANIFLNIIKNLNYIFINNILEDNNYELFGTSYIENIFNISKNDIIFINPDKNHYDSNHEFYKIANIFMNYLVIDYSHIIINAAKIILCDEKYFNLAVHLNLKSNNCLMYSNNNYNLNKFITIKPQKKILVTFGGGHIIYHNAVNRLCDQANKLNIFDKIYGFTENDLINDSIFWNEHSNFIVNNLRGLGYWIWKGYLIKKIMESEYINENDIILYLDCGCEINIYGKERFIEYLDLTNKYNNLAFYMGCIEKQYTKMDLFKYMNTSIENMNNGQLTGNVIFFKKNNDNLKFLKELNDLYKYNNYHLVDDSSSIELNDESFIEHRHDQSCYSLLIKKYNMFKIPCETYFDPDWSNGLKFPILTMRNKSGNSLLPKYFN